MKFEIYDVYSDLDFLYIGINICTRLCINIDTEIESEIDIFYKCLSKI